jgi:hypothetical protein
MGERYWLWMGARLLVAVAIVAWAASYLGTGSGEKEFQKTLDAMKRVHSFRVAAMSAPVTTQHEEMLWEVDCDHDLLHHHLHLVQTTANSPEMNMDQTYAAGREYDRKDDGTWLPSRYGNFGQSAKGYCGRLAEGTDSGLLPQIATMIKRGVIQKGDKKTVNGVRCRQWLVTMKGGMNGLEHDTICLGLEDHLPYEMTVDWEHSRASYSDYNAPLEIAVPEAAAQPASSTSSN